MLGSEDGKDDEAMNGVDWTNDCKNEKINTMYCLPDEKSGYSALSEVLNT